LAFGDKLGFAREHTDRSPSNEELRGISIFNCLFLSLLLSAFGIMDESSHSREEMPLENDGDDDDAGLLSSSAAAIIIGGDEGKKEQSDIIATPSIWAHLRVLLWRNWTVGYKSCFPLVFIVVLLPASVIGVLAILQGVVTWVLQSRGNETPHLYSVPEFSKCTAGIVGHECTTLLYAPGGVQWVDRVMRHLADRSGLEWGVDVRPLQGGSDPSWVANGLWCGQDGSSLCDVDSLDGKLDDWEQDRLGSLCLPCPLIWDNATMADGFLASPNATRHGVIFHSAYMSLLPDAAGDTVPPENGYTIHYNGSLSFYSPLGSALGSFQNGAPPGELLSAKVAIDAALLLAMLEDDTEEAVGRGDGEAEVPVGLEIDVSYEDFPFTKSRFADFDVVAFEGGLFLFLPALVPFLLILIGVAAERDAGLVLPLQVAGVHCWAHLLSWATVGIVVSAIMAIAVVTFSWLLGLSIFVRTSPGIMLCIFFLTGFSTATAALAISTFVSSTKQAQSVGFAVVLMGMLSQVITSSSGGVLVRFMYIDHISASGSLSALAPALPWLRVLRNALTACAPTFNFSKALSDISWAVGARMDYGGNRVTPPPPGAWFGWEMLINGGIRETDFGVVLDIPPAWMSLAALASQSVLFLLLSRCLWWHWDTAYAAKRTSAASNKLHEWNEPRLSAVEISKSFLRRQRGWSTSQRVHALKGASLSVRGGEVVALLGRNGAGKSSAIGALLGLQGPPDSGEAQVCGYSVHSHVAEARQFMGFCPQFGVIYDSLTCMEHLELYGSLRGKHWSRSANLNEVNQALAAVGLESKAHAKAGELSGGMQRRLALAVASMGSPEVYLLDEPSSGVDPVTQRIIWDVIRGFAARGAAVVLTTHSMVEVQALANSVVVLSQGKVVESGSVEHLLRSRRRFYLEAKLRITGESGGEEVAERFEAVVHAAGSKVERRFLVGTHLRAELSCADSSPGSMMEAAGLVAGLRMLESSGILSRMEIKSNDVSDAFSAAVMSGCEVKEPCRLWRPELQDLTEFIPAKRGWATILRAQISATAVKTALVLLREKGGVVLQLLLPLGLTLCMIILRLFFTGGGSMSSTSYVVPGVWSPLNFYSRWNYIDECYSMFGYSLRPPLDKIFGSKQVEYGLHSDSPHVGTVNLFTLAANECVSCFSEHIGDHIKVGETVRRILPQRSAFDTPALEFYQWSDEGTTGAPPSLVRVIFSDGSSPNGGIQAMYGHESGAEIPRGHCGGTSSIKFGSPFRPVSPQIVISVKALSMEDLDGATPLWLDFAYSAIDVNGSTCYGYVLIHWRLADGMPKALAESMLISPSFEEFPSSPSALADQLKGTLSYLDQFSLWDAKSHNFDLPDAVMDIHSLGRREQNDEEYEFEYTLHVNEHSPWEFFRPNQAVKHRFHLGNQVEDAMWVDAGRLTAMDLLHRASMHWIRVDAKLRRSNDTAFFGEGFLEWGMRDVLSGAEGLKSSGDTSKADLAHAMESIVLPAIGALAPTQTSVPKAALSDELLEWIRQLARMNAVSTMPTVARPQMAHITELAGALLYPLALSLPFPAFVMSGVVERTSGMLNLQRSMGLFTVSHTFSSVAVNMTMYMASALLFWMGGVAAGLSLFASTSPALLFAIIFLWGVALVCTATFLARCSWLKSKSVASMASYALIFVGAMIAEAISSIVYGHLQKLSVHHPIPFLAMAAWPQLAMTRGLYLMGQACSFDTCYGSLSDMEDENELWTVIAALAASAVLWSALAVWLAPLSHCIDWIWSRCHCRWDYKPLSSEEGTEVELGETEIDVAATAPAIAFLRVSKSYNPPEATEGCRRVAPRIHVQALNGVDLIVERGSCMGLLGPNGAGKTTLLSVLMGRHAPDEGEVRVEGSVLEPGSAPQGLGICPQLDVLYDNLTVLEHCQFFDGFKSGERGNRLLHVTDVLAAVDLLDHAFKTPSELSGGMRRRLSLAMAMAGGSHTLVLDEPSTGLDVVTRKEIGAVLKRAVTLSGRTILLSTHDMVEAEELCSHVAVLEGGRLHEAGEVDNVKERAVGGHVLSVIWSQDSTNYDRRLVLRELLSSGAVEVEMNNLGCHLHIPKWLPLSEAVVLTTAIGRSGLWLIRPANLEDVLHKIVRDAAAAESIIRAPAHNHTPTTVSSSLPTEQLFEHAYLDFASDSGGVNKKVRSLEGDTGTETAAETDDRSAAVADAPAPPAVQEAAPENGSETAADVPQSDAAPLFY
jgi:ABC-type multidrug transport system ATPase subunit